MIHEAMIDLPQRGLVPATSIYTKRYTKGKLGERDVMILLPGGPGNEHGTYETPPGRAIAAALFPDVDLLLFDPRACGQSASSPTQFCSLDHYIDDVEAIRQYFNLSPERFIVFGQSYGAIAALGYAAKYPACLKKLLLIAGAASGSALEQAQENLARIGNAEQKKWGKKLFTGTFTGSETEFTEYYESMGPLYAYTFTPGQPTPRLNYNVNLTNYGFGDFLWHFDFRPQLPGITCPVLMLWGQEDWILDLRQGKEIQQAIPQSQLKIYPQCGHLLWIDQWERFVEDARAFLQS